MASPLVQSLVAHRMEVKRVEKRAEMEMELAERREEIKQESMQGVEERQQSQRVVREEPAENDSGNAVMDLMEREDCNLCKSLLREIDDLTGTDRERALQEYGRLKEKMETADKGELKDFIDSTEVLSGVFEEVV